MASLRVSLLETADRDVLHEGALTVLDEVGVRFESVQARRILAEAGCRVDDDAGRVRFSRELVEWAVDRLRRDVLLAGRDRHRDVVLDGSQTCVVPAGICPYVADKDTGLRRDASLGDLMDVGLVCDALDEIGALWFPFVPVAESLGRAVDLASLAGLLSVTGKHIQGQLVRPEDVPVALEMVRLASPEDDHRRRPIFSSLYCPISPLTHDEEAVEAAMAMAAEHIPILIITLPLAGGTAPVTLAGAVVQNTAETLSAVVLLKLVDEDCPLILAGTTGIMEMSSGAFSTAVPEIALMNVAQIELIHSYGAPAMSVGYPTDSYGFSHKAGIESMGSGTITRLARPDMMLGPGNMEAANTFSLTKLVLDAELLGYSERLLQGMAIDQGHAQVASICEVGPGGNFLEREETLRFMRAGEHWHPRLLRRTTYAEWENGAANEVANAKARAEEILTTHRPPALPSGAEKAIAELLAAVSR